MANKKHKRPKKQTARTGEPLRAAGVLFEADTDYGHIEVGERFFRGHRARLLFVDGALESAMALERGERQTLLFPYLRRFDEAVRLRPEQMASGDALLIGGGGFVYADHFLVTHPGSRMDAAEISPEIIDTARRYFSLSALESGERAERFRLSASDGVSFLLGTEKTYDFIFNDAFCGRDFDTGLPGTYGIILTRAHLKEEGLYVVNFVTAVNGPLSLPGRRLKKRLLRQFPHVLLLQADETRSPLERQNCVLIAANREL